MEGARKTPQVGNQSVAPEHLANGAYAWGNGHEGSKASTGERAQDEASQFSVSQFLKTYEDEFLEVVNPKLNLMELKHEGVISENVRTAILDTADDKEAKYILLEHLQKNATVDTLRVYCDVAIAANGYSRMQELGKKMKAALPPGEGKLTETAKVGRTPRKRPSAGPDQAPDEVIPKGVAEPTGEQSGWLYFRNLVTSKRIIIAFPILMLVVALMCYYHCHAYKDHVQKYTASQVPASCPTSPTVGPSAHYNPSRPSDKQEHVLQPSLRAHGTTTIMLPPMPTELKVISCVLLHNKVYISGTDTKGRQVQVYSLKNNTWSTLPEAPSYNAPIAIVNNRITLIGGRDVKTDKQSNVISTWFEEEERWKQDLDSLPTMLAASEAYHHGDILLVTGGVEEGSSTAVDKVHVYNLSSKKWATPQQLRLPKALRSHHLVRLGEYIYLLGGATRFQDSADTTDKDHNLNAWKARWADIEEAVQHQDLTVQPTQHEKSIWESIADLPAPLPTVVLCGSSIISVGGKDNSSPVKAIYEFVDDKWVKVGDMSVGRYNHGVVPLGTRGAALLVAGGFKWELYDEDTVKTTSVEMVLL